MEPVLLLQHLHERGGQPQVQFRGDDQGWFEAEVEIALSGPALSLQRYLANEEGIRAELNTWAAWLETVEDNSHALPLMQRIVSPGNVHSADVRRSRQSRVGQVRRNVPLLISSDGRRLPDRRQGLFRRQWNFISSRKREMNLLFFLSLRPLRSF